MMDGNTPAGLAATEAECAAGRTAPRVSLADIEANIAIAVYRRGSEFAGMGGLASVLPDARFPSLGVLTICLLVLENGFTIIGKSAPASVENFDAQLGEKLAYEDAVRQVWPLMGYELRERLHRADQALGTAQAAPAAKPSLELGAPACNQASAAGNVLAGSAGVYGRGDSYQRVRIMEMAVGAAGMDRVKASAIVSIAKEFEDFVEGVDRPEPKVGTPTGMVRYIGTKIIDAKPMTRGEYNQLRGWPMPADEDPTDAGYLVQYTDGGAPNLDGFPGYVSWTPAFAFDQAYRPL